ncbi:monooxygenase 2-like [Punica granatum]|uniref:Monooxygenase 2-like n=1 Tax=Punica granatum TaxID=22663 RepID=A0A6P8EAF3_PUNGR|nr:monooxygenase 2-like [Punica granatum]
MEEEAVIVGAGICGLATAVALKRVGIRAVVLERASELRTTGAAILLWSNAWLALNALGVTDKLNLLYAPIERGFFTDVKTKSTQQVVYASKERDGPRAVHRKILLQVLADELPLDTIRFSSKLTSVESIVKDGHRISVLRLHDGAIIKAKVVIGCDGVHSVIAKRLKLSPPVRSGRSGVGGISVYPAGHGLSPNVQQFVDVSKRAAIIPLNDKEVYWFLVLQTTPEDKDIGNDPESIQRAVMENWAKDFPLSYLDIVQQSDLSTVSFASLMFRYPWDVVLGTLSTENIVVAGDAMHPTTPELGQGGCMALEDAVVLGRHMGNSLDPKGKLRPGDVGCALGKYVGERRWRTAWIIVGSYLSGWVQQDGSGWWMKFLRDLFYKTIQTRVINLVHYDCGRLPNRMGTSL